MLTDMEFELTPRQIKMMKHAIGMNNPKGKPYNYNRKSEDGYEAYRNRYYSEKNRDWERLVENGLATASPDSNGLTIYRITEDGANVLSEILDIKIIL